MSYPLGGNHVVDAGVSNTLPNGVQTSCPGLAQLNCHRTSTDLGPTTPAARASHGSCRPHTFRILPVVRPRVNASFHVTVVNLLEPDCREGQIVTQMQPPKQLELEMCEHPARQFPPLGESTDPEFAVSPFSQEPQFRIHLSASRRAYKPPGGEIFESATEQLIAVLKLMSSGAKWLACRLLHNSSVLRHSSEPLLS